MRFVILIMILLISSISVLAQDIPEDKDVTEHKYIATEHKNTREFFSEEFTRQRNQLFKDFDERGRYYEDKFTSTINGAVLKLSLLWAGIVIFVFGISNFLRIKKEHSQYELLKKCTKEYVMGELTRQKQKEDEDKINNLIKEPVPPEPPKEKRTLRGLFNRKPKTRPKHPEYNIGNTFTQNYWTEVRE